MKNTNYAKIFLGLILIATGVVFILVLAGVTPIDRSTIIPLYWPSLVVIFGTYLLLEAIPKRTTAKSKFSKIYFSFSVILVGLALLENNINYFSDTDIPVWGLITALIVIFIGISIMFFNTKVSTHNTYKTKSGKRIIINTDFDSEDIDGVTIDIQDENEEDSINSDTKNEENTENVDNSEKKNRKDSKKKNKTYKTNQSRFIGEIRLGDSSWVLQDSDYSVGVGDIHIDITTAFLEEGETTLNISGWVGDIKILVPDDLAVDITASTNVGEVSLIGLTNGSGSGPSKSSGVTSNSVNFKSENYDTAIKKLRIYTNLNIGEITIKQV